MQYEVSPSGIREHAVSLAGIEGDVRSASSAAQTTVDAQAFGVVNGFLASTVGLFGSAITQGIANAAEDLGETVAILRTQANNHESTDAGASSTITGAGR